MTTQSSDKDLPHSPGNQGSRGSRGQANRGAEASDSTNEGADAQLPADDRDLQRDPDAQGGGGISSGSSRSK